MKRRLEASGLNFSPKTGERERFRYWEVTRISPPWAAEAAEGPCGVHGGGCSYGDRDCECRSGRVEVAGLLCALCEPIHQILSYVHQFNTSTSV